VKNAETPKSKHVKTARRQSVSVGAADKAAEGGYALAVGVVCLYKNAEGGGDG
jgi:hypothetical protein